MFDRVINHSLIYQRCLLQILDQHVVVNTEPTFNGIISVRQRQDNYENFDQRCADDVSIQPKLVKSVGFVIERQ
uniref:Uncharacterized protein n=1 Tax=Romanomermis culicivorax TaxID=13658 RepID=A0A915JLA1_ROMCU